MGILESVYRRVGPLASPNLKARVRRTLEQFLKPGTVTSYSQFGEDVFLLGYFEAKAYREGKQALPLGRPKVEHGFYIDIGAYSPKHFSNTYLFYKRGWRGICVDATPGSIKAFDAIRPRDINLEMAISNESRHIDFFWWGIPGGVNTASKEHAETWTRKLGRPPQKTRVLAVTLEELLSMHLGAGQRIDFMTIDVEGHDLEVVSSNNWSKYRPELVVIEKDVESGSNLIDNPVSKFMTGVAYVLHAWLPPNLVFRDASQCGK